jgi:hypothetical protein
MKSLFNKLSAGIPLTMLVIACAQVTFAQQNLTVTPPMTSNSYPGVITLTMTGLTNGESVRIQRWLDLNGNGLIDANEPMIDAFGIADNDLTSNIIGGATNINVPFDSNPTNGVITTTLNFAPALVLDNLVGQHIFRLVSPTGRFPSVTATFVVTNSAYSQSVSGIVYSNAGTPFPNAVVVAQDLQANNPSGAVVADSNGRYFLKLPVGSYGLISVNPNYYIDQSMAPSVTLTNGMAATNDLYETNGTVTISGNVRNASNTNAIGGLLLQFQSGNLFAIGFTDTNGNYSAAVTPGFWKVETTKERLVRRGYVVPQAKYQLDTTSGAVSNANIALPKGNALFYGRLTDNSNTPFNNVEFDGSTGNDYSAKGYSDANGYYSVAVLALTNEFWNCNVNSGKGTAIENYVLNTFNTMLLTTNETVLQNFVAIPANGRITGQVTDNSGNPVSGVTLTSGANIGGKNYQSLDGTTDNSGNYSLSVASGFWNVQFLTGGGSGDNLDEHGFVDLTGPHNVTIPPTNATLNLTVFPIGTPVLDQFQRFSATQFGFNISGATNVNYTVQVSTNLASTNWANLFSFQLTTNPFPVVDTHATNSSRFYRVQKN